MLVGIGHDSTRPVPSGMQPLISTEKLEQEKTVKIHVRGWEPHNWIKLSPGDSFVMTFEVTDSLEISEKIE